MLAMQTGMASTAATYPNVSAGGDNGQSPGGSEIIGYTLQQLLNALTVAHKGKSGYASAKTHPIAAGNKCNVCGMPNGHPSGFCFYEYPEKGPNWAPTTRANPELVKMWNLRRQQRNLPPLALRQVPSMRAQQPPAYTTAANLSYVMAPSAPVLPAPAPMPMLPAPTEHMGSAVQMGSTGSVPTLSAVAQLDLSLESVRQVLAGAVMPRSFLQYPAVAPVPSQGEVSVVAEESQPAPVPGGARVGIDSSQNGEFRAGGKGRVRGLAKRLRFADDRKLAIQAKTSGKVEAMIVELQLANQVPCLDTFVNMTAATGVSMQLPDGRWQLSRLVITDSGATYGVAFEDAYKSVGLAFTSCGVVLILADTSKVHILGMTDPVKLLFARGTVHERAIMYRYIVLPGSRKHYNWLIAKNALLELGAYVDPLESSFVYRVSTQAGDPKHALPVKCSVPLDEADPADCIHMLQPVVAVMSSYKCCARQCGACREGVHGDPSTFDLLMEPAASAAGPCC